MKIQKLEKKCALDMKVKQAKKMFIYFSFKRGYAKQNKKSIISWRKKNYWLLQLSSKTCTLKTFQFSVS